ncbi:tRNA pseudouridine(13) synthase TruD [Candidatus Micrarchaeota archaeon]|nr:tRNA pseudouridine(13) synthase TruD [Candidatus Micrarchaeota archaeon]
MYEIKRIAEDFIVEEIMPNGETIGVNDEFSFDEKSRGNELVCVLVKRNWDTHLAIREIANRLHGSPKRVGFAGMKDKAALTAQRISISGAKKEDVERILIKDIKLIPLYYSSERVKLGDLNGNSFTIKVYAKKMKKAARVPNYFGEQRFGTTRPITHLVGREIIRENPERAVKIYLAKVFKGEKDETKEARKRLAKGYDFKKALDYFPRHLKFERTMIAHLAEYPGDYIGALRVLPKFLKLMFVHAYQSYLFNKYLDKVINKKKKYEDGPLFGYDTKLTTKEEQEILDDEGVSLSEFLVDCMPEMSSPGMKRALFIEPKDFKVLEHKKDYYMLRFSLPKGAYATTVIEHLFS